MQHIVTRLKEIQDQQRKEEILMADTLSRRNERIVNNSNGEFVNRYKGMVTNKSTNKQTTGSIDTKSENNKKGHTLASIGKLITELNKNIKFLEIQKNDSSHSAEQVETICKSLRDNVKILTDLKVLKINF